MDKHSGLISASFLTNTPAIWRDLPFENCMFWGGISTLITPFVAFPWIGLEMKVLHFPSMCKSIVCLSQLIRDMLESNLSVRST